LRRLERHDVELAAAASPIGRRPVMVTGQETGGRVRGGTFLRGARLPLILAAGALVALTAGGLAAATLGGCGNGAADQGAPTASPTETPSAWFTPEPLGEHGATTREKRILAAAADYVNDPKNMPWRTHPKDFRKYVGQPGAIVAYVVVLMQKGIEVSAVVDTANGEVRPIATLGQSFNNPYFGVPWFTYGMTRSRPVRKGETWATEAAKYWFYDHVLVKLGWPVAAKPEVAGYIVGWPDVGVLQIYVHEVDGKPYAWGLGRYLPV
jgi:hypothetical protein